jgi:trehalose 6-phosphate phosphatase
MTHSHVTLMKNLLLPRNVEVLGKLASSRALLAFDFDGTLAPIVTGPTEAGMRVSTRRLFRRVCELFPTAVISGRGRGDVAGRLCGARVKYVVGNHGAEDGRRSKLKKSLLDEARVQLQELAAHTPGLQLEDKGLSLSVHYRRVKHPVAAKRSILKVLQQLRRPLRAMGGKMVINVLPEGARDKGHALLELCRQTHSKVALYVGDDVTDEDVFALKQPRRVLGVRIGRSAQSAAEYYVKTQDDIDALLRRLIELRGEAP